MSAKSQEWTPEEDSILLQMKRDGATYQQIGEVLDRSRNSVRSHWRRMDTGETHQKFTDKTEGNYRWVQYIDPDVRTLDDLIKASKIDTKVWEIYKHDVNKWSVGAKAERKNLSFDKGVMSGEVESPGLVVAPLFQVKAYMIRRELEPVKPMLQPVEIKVTFPSVPKKSAGELKRELIIPDAQIGYRRNAKTGKLDPFHERGAIDIALQIAEDHAFDGGTFLGDWLDWTMWTERFAREPEFYFTTQPAVYEGSWWLAQFRKAMLGVPMKMIDSNHDRRLINTLQSHVIDACELKPGLEVSVYPVLSVPFLLCLEKLGIEWIDGYPNAKTWINDELSVEHGNIARAGAGSTAKAIVDNSVNSKIFGHIHRIEWATKTVYYRNEKKTIKAFSPGCLCRIDGTVPGHTENQDWQQGIAVVDYKEDGYFNISPIEIIDGEASYGGKLYKARDRIAQIRKEIPDTDWNF